MSEKHAAPSDTKGNLPPETEKSELEQALEKIKGTRERVIQHEQTARDIRRDLDQLLDDLQH